VIGKSILPLGFICTIEVIGDTLDNE